MTQYYNINTILTSGSEAQTKVTYKYCSLSSQWLPKHFTEICDKLIYISMTS